MSEEISFLEKSKSAIICDNFKSGQIGGTLGIFEQLKTEIVCARKCRKNYDFLNKYIHIYMYTDAFNLKYT